MLCIAQQTNLMPVLKRSRENHQEEPLPNTRTSHHQLMFFTNAVMQQQRLILQLHSDDFYLSIKPDDAEISKLFDELHFIGGFINIYFFLFW